MKIALYGTGRMGNAIAQVCEARGHEVVLTVGSSNAGTPPAGADVAIEFSVPSSAMENMRLCIAHGIPVVVGTTGWYDHLPALTALVAEKNASLLWASNFSIGVNLFFRVNRQLAALMDPHPGYAVQVDEVHHIHKLDAPSGTAITLARDIDLKTQRYSGWELSPERSKDATKAHRELEASGAVPIASERVGEVPGKHSVSWISAEDRIIITHEAFGRKGFATGAVVAAEWLADPVQRRHGLFTMDDVLDNSH